MTKKAPYSTSFSNSKGRLHIEAESINRNPFQRDRDRVIHSDSFRLLKHKTQVFVAHTGDYYRTRLTHSLEVSQIARTVARRLEIDEDLAEVLALAHDLGHPPFAHSGEDVLDKCMNGYDGFDHNAQTLRILTTLEERYPLFNGLNLTWETLEGIAKHNGPLEDPHISIKNFNKIYDLDLNTFPGLEAQIASLSDDIAYNNHDIDDGFRAGFINLDDLKNIEFLAEIINQISLEFKEIEDHMVVKELIRRLIGLMVDDLITQTKKNLATFLPTSVEGVRNSPTSIASFSDFFISQDKIIRDFLRSRVYEHVSIESERINSKKIIEGLFSKLINNIDLLPNQLKKKCDIPKSKISARVVCDYIASMTDRSAVENHAILYGKDIMDQPGY
ncbi:deoxyguanosinetriphosphate triphosphohydrolase [Hyphomicrobiales bacterium]|jgi:dGTPase|nr:deoxyguanosinetriphosphate triphosphohydrolase [Hyphomicrobiales bacterium]MDG1152279.1 deoxyguanosinetriphosphate triphosphohydrolase [Hyphomicrobiales bacterium]MDG1523672.1 deoxyguanosinetriphosphate triphosphohydrolase [Hyphomicrobiales bacterium]MDG2413140.1 deoxyguanosinetriphosphate triphosphohydrolase [Hyphomicrobiales bacterium]|tara:strand:+ start:335 stop:1498 length:1164 start_codon:yes stop_codon:yes gene_type:complete